MRHALSIVVLAFLGLSGLVGCGLLNDGPQQAICEGRVECTIRLGAYVNDERPLKPGETLFVRGNCEQTDGVAIRVVSFAGQRMENPGFNYEQWEVEFGYAFVTTYDTGEGVAELPMHAVDACGELTVFEPVQIPLSDGTDLVDETQP